MLVVVPPIFVADTKIYGYNFKAPLNTTDESNILNTILQSRKLKKQTSKMPIPGPNKILNSPHFGLNHF